MLSTRFSLPLFLVAILAVAGLFASDEPPRAAGGASAEPEAATRTPGFDEVLRPFLKDHCIHCHGGTDPEAGLRLDAISADLADGVDAASWENVLERVQAGEMPPPDEPRPPAAETKAVLEWIDAGLRQAERKSGAGTVAIRRLNNREYDNTIRDLLGVDCRPAQSFPPDDRANGFDNVGSALSVSPLLLEKYVEAAGLVARRALDPTRPAVIRERLHGPDFVKRKDLDPEAPVIVVSRDEGGSETLLPYFLRSQGKRILSLAPGEYRIRLRANAVGATTGSVALSREQITYLERFQKLPPGFESPRLLFYCSDGREREVVGRIVTDRETREYELRFYAEAGRTFEFILENAARVIPRRFSIEDYLELGPGVNVHWIEVEGPLAESWPTPVQKRVFFRGEDAEKTRDYAKEILERFASRAFRRPASPEQVERLLRAYDAARAGDRSFEEGVIDAVQVALCSPSFLYLVEPATSPSTPGEKRPLDAYELASRLSYFLWSSMPDDELFAAAADGSLLRDDRALAEQVRRMLKDPKSAALTDGFLSQWLQLEKLNEVAVDRRMYRDYDDYLKDLFQQETEAFFAEALHRDRSVLTFIDSDFAMLNDRLAQHYGIEGVAGAELRPVALPPGSRRGGLVTQGSVLTMTTCGTRTSPIHRGLWVMETLLGTPPPPPPRDIPELPPDVQGTQTMRERLTKHRADPSCARCHDMIDPLGFALENYDVIGAWRERMPVPRSGPASSDPAARGRSRSTGPPPVIDASGVMPGGKAFQGPDDFRKLLLDRKDDFCRGLVERLLAYALGRGLTRGDRSTVDALTRSLVANDYRLPALIVEITKSEPFQTK
ncbi:MAG: DUF1592 domain-containing protein [Planctomycetales bacterium]